METFQIVSQWNISGKTAEAKPVAPPAIVGRYAVRIRWSDGHDTGLYSFGVLRVLEPRSEASPCAPPSFHQDAAV